LKALEKIPGVGASIAKKIEEYILKGRIGYYEGLKRQLPVDLAQITSIQGVGPRRARVLYQKLGIKTVDDLEKPRGGTRSRIYQALALSPRWE
jgi:DNA polymerase IV (family X)